jgi:hypothetical protein
MADAARPSSGPTGSTSSVPPQHPPGNPAGELRLAVVMNGGVSLAIWMGGVAHELDLLRRASARDERPSGATGPIGRDAVPDYDRPVFDAWRRAAGRQGVGAVVIDVIAGTSAGGLNGALLATAAARGSSLDPPDADHADGPYLRQVWEKEAALEQGHLLRGGERNGTLPTSVLDGEYFEQMIESVLGRIRAPVGPRQPPSSVTRTPTTGRSSSPTTAGCTASARIHGATSTHRSSTSPPGGRCPSSTTSQPS